MSRSEALGPVHEVELPGGRVTYRERGAGPPVVFVHGLLVNADLWRAVSPAVAQAGYRCIAPDWPLGSHRVAVPGADLSPPGVAQLIANLLEKLDLRDVTVVANDTGGALVQLLMVNAPDRVGRVVLTSCDCFEWFFPPVFAFLPPLARVPGAIWALTQLLRIRVLHRLPIAFGWVSKRPVPPEVVDSYLLPSRTDPAVRRDLTRFLRGVNKSHTLAAAAELPGFDKPVLLAWAEQDRLFPLKLAHRLEKLLPQATFVGVGDSYTFIPEDQPAVLTDLIVDFARTHAAT